MSKSRIFVLPCKPAHRLETMFSGRRLSANWEARWGTRNGAGLLKGFRQPESRQRHCRACYVD